MELMKDILDSTTLQVVELNKVKHWLRSPDIAKIVESVGYLADKYSAQVDQYSSPSGVAIYLTLRNLTGLKDESLAALLYSMECHNPRNTYTDDAPASYSRTYRYYWYTDKTLSVHITANFSEDSDTCKRVITGYKEPSSEPVPIYELRCSDEPVEAVQS